MSDGATDAGDADARARAGTNDDASSWPQQYRGHV
jgi:hypothetical protein